MQDIHGLFFRDFNNAYFPEILKELYRDRVYKDFIELPSTTKLGLRDDLTILDIGGNVGLFTFYAYQFAKKIYTVEPSKEHFEVLNHMVKFNKMDDKVTTVNKAIANENKMMTFYHNSNTTMFSLKDAVNDKTSEPEEVEAITLDTLFTQNNIKHVDFMKLDIEGAEAEVIGGSGFEQVADKIDSLVVEYHTWSRVNPNLVINALRDYGFEVKQIPTDAVLLGAKRK